MSIFDFDPLPFGFFPPNDDAIPPIDEEEYKQQCEAWEEDHPEEEDEAYHFWEDDEFTEEPEDPYWDGGL